MSDSAQQSSKHQQPPVGVPIPDANVGQSVSRFFRGYVVFRGRANRSEYWWAFLLFSLLGATFIVFVAVSAMLTIISQIDDLAPGEVADEPFIFTLLRPITIVLSLGIILPFLALTWRRLQDAGFHGALSLLALLPTIGLIPIIMCAMPTSPKALQFGPGAIPGPDGRFYEPDEFARAGFAQQGSGGQWYGQSEPYVQNPLPHGQQGPGQQGYGNQGYGNPNFPPQR